MDSSKPIAMRTRLREDRYFKELHEKIKGKKSNNVDSESVNGIEFNGSGVREGSAEVEARVDENVDLGYDSDLLEVSGGGGECGDDSDVECLGFDGWGSNSAEKSKTGVENFENAIPIDDDDDDSDNDVKVIGEKGEGGLSFVNSNFSSTKTGSGSGSKFVGGKEGEKFIAFDIDDVVESGCEVGATNGVALSSERSSASGVAKGVQSQIGDLDKIENVNDIDENVNDADENVIDLVNSDEMEMHSEEDNEDWDELEASSDSEEDDNDDADEDYRQGESSDRQSLEQSTSSEHEEGEDVDGVSSSGREEGEYVDSGSVLKNKRTDGEPKEVKRNVGLKRKKVYGLDVLVDCDKDRNADEGNPINLTRVHKSVAQRTRSRLDSNFIQKKMKLGTVSRPYCIDVEELDSSRGYDCDDEDKHSEKEIQTSAGNADHLLPRVGAKDEDDLGNPTKRKRVRALKMDVFKILVDSIIDKGEGVSATGRIPYQETNPLVIETSLPLKFPYPIKEPPPEKSEGEKHLDQLWEEFTFALRSSEIGYSDSLMVENEDSTFPDVKTDPASLCSRGNHQLIVDEQIGVKCKICSFVKLEIKYHSPSFDTHPWGRSEKRDYGKMEHRNLNKLQFEDSSCNSLSGCGPHVHAEGTVWEIIPGIKDSMYAHQREGFEFIWKNIAGGIFLDKLKKSNNFNGGKGCVISHAPGTGKTRLIIVFLQTYMRLNPTCRPIIIAPRSMLLTWAEEFKKWKFDMPFHNLNNPELSGKESGPVLDMLRNGDRSTDNIRMTKIYSWYQDKSILGLSYRLFERLVGGGGEEAVRQGKKKNKVRAQDEYRKILLEVPDLLVLDEGHTARNDQSLIWKALSQIETEKRIILSGTPFQNNFDELYNTLCLVRPSFADTLEFQPHHYNDFHIKRGRKASAARGRWTNLTNSIGKVANDRLEELQAMIDPFVHVHKGAILQESLPGLRDSVVVLHPAPFQKSLLEGVERTKNVLRLGFLVSLISTHPSLLLLCQPSEKEQFICEKDKLERLRLIPDAGVKTKFLMELIRLSEALNEKILVFSQYIHPLTLIMDQLKSHFNWHEGKEVLYMDGTRDVKQRQTSINVFNESTSEVKVLLASIKACSEGINLIGASRVVLLDVVWNPSVERQAISRAYRLGQKRVVYIYHLITSGTMEGEKYCRQAEKDRLSELVFSSTQRDCNGKKISNTFSDDEILEEMIQHDKIKDMFEKIIYQPKESNLIETFGRISS